MSYSDDLDELFGHKKEMSMEEFFVGIAKVAREMKVSISVDINGDGTEVNVSPWESYQPVCPYSRREEVSRND